ncbi:MAG: hypothetical protein Q4F63_03915 [Clostridia bacterium]|nr:hypothetical protein [Clostridia bacterium]
MKNDNNLFFVCSLIEFIGREVKLKRSDVVKALGEDVIRRIYNFADVFHCEPIAKVADDFITMCNIKSGDYDNVRECKYEVPDYWTIGEVYERLIEDIGENDVIEALLEVYGSWISDAISNYNSDFFYQSRDYIRECYKAQQVI